MNGNPGSLPKGIADAPSSQSFHVPVNLCLGEVGVCAMYISRRMYVLATQVPLDAREVMMIECNSSVTPLK